MLDEDMQRVVREQAAALTSPAYDDGSSEDDGAQRSLELYGMQRRNR